MKKEIRKKLELSLSEVIDNWLGTFDDEDITCYVGDNINEYMAKAALSVLLAVEDTQDYLKDEGMFNQSGGQEVR
jgi:hypothetical protein